MSSRQVNNKRARLGKSLLWAGAICWMLPVLAVGLTPVLGPLAGWAAMVLAVFLLPLGLLLFIVGFVVFVVRGKAGAAYEDSPNPDES